MVAPTAPRPLMAFIFPGNASGQPSIVYPVDACLSESQPAESEVTKHPVEDGVAISDHVIIQPIDYQCECIVSDTPIGRVALDPTRINLEGASTPSVEFHTRMMAMRGTRQTCSIVTLRFGTLTSMMLTSYEPKADSSTGNSIQFSAKFTQINVLTTSRTTVRVAVPNTGGETDQGNQPGGPLTGQYLTWRHAAPAGSPNIFRVEILSVQQKQGNPPNTTGKKPPPLQFQLHHGTSSDKTKSGEELTTAEYEDFTLDYQRDAAATLATKVAANEAQLNNIHDTLDRAQKFAAAKDAAAKDPTKGPVTRQMFGL